MRLGWTRYFRRADATTGKELLCVRRRAAFGLRATLMSNQALARGYVPVDYQPLESTPTLAWYRGPLAPLARQSLEPVRIPASRCRADLRREHRRSWTCRMRRPGNSDGCWRSLRRPSRRGCGCLSNAASTRRSSPTRSQLFLSCIAALSRNSLRAARRRLKLSR